MKGNLKSKLLPPLLMLIGCARGPHVPTAIGTDLSRAAMIASDWHLPPASGREEQVRYLTQGKMDSARVARGPGIMGEYDHADGTRLSVMGAEIWKWRDTLAVSRSTFAPSWERLYLGGQKISLEYRGRTVRRTVQVGDSVPVTTTVVFPEPVFAFSQAEMIIRSIPRRVGYTVVLPLYSEVDAAVEHDTLTVVAGPRPGDDHPVWQVRFADPVITALYTIDATTQKVVRYETQQRFTGSRMWRLPQDSL